MDMMDGWMGWMDGVDVMQHASPRVPRPGACSPQAPVFGFPGPSRILEQLYSCTDNRMFIMALSTPGWAVYGTGKCLALAISLWLYVFSLRSWNDSQNT